MFYLVPTLYIVFYTLYIYQARILIHIGINLKLYCITFISMWFGCYTFFQIKHLFLNYNKILILSYLFEILNLSHLILLFFIQTFSFCIDFSQYKRCSWNSLFSWIYNNYVDINNLQCVSFYFVTAIMYLNDWCKRVCFEYFSIDTNILEQDPAFSIPLGWSIQALQNKQNIRYLIL